MPENNRSPDEIEAFLKLLLEIPGVKRFRTWHPDVEKRFRDLLEKGEPTLARFMAESLGAHELREADRWAEWQHAYGLSPRETELVQALAEGKSLPDFAKETGKAYSTVKSQLLSVFRKTGTSRQVELIDKLRRG